MKQTKFDSMVTTPTMQLVKAVIPYIDNPIGRYLGMFIKFQELQNAAMINNNVSIAAMNADKHKGMESMLEDILDFLGDDTRETFENIKSMMEMMEAMNGMDMNEDMMNAFMGSAFNGDATSSSGGNNNTAYDNNEEKRAEPNENTASPQDEEPYFNSYEEPFESQNNEYAYDKNDDVTSSPMNYEKGLNNYE